MNAVLMSVSASIPAQRLAALRTELADLAFELERQGRCDAADITNMLAARLAEVAGEIPADGEPAPEARLLTL